MVEPTQYGPLFVAEGVAGIGFTTTFVVPAGLVQPFTVTVTLYTPPIAVIALAIEGF
jgi:hypothetical protein